MAPGALRQARPGSAAARNIWGALPPDPEKSVLLFGEMVTSD
jgi:hypothetical protein